MIPWVRILLYFTIFTLIIIKLQKKNSSLTPIETVAAFALKVILGSAYGYIHLRFYNGDDTWLYNNRLNIMPGGQVPANKKRKSNEQYSASEKENAQHG